MRPCTFMLIAVVAFSGCGKNDVQEIRETRAVSPPLPAPSPHAGAGSAAANGQGHPEYSAYTWEAPAGWMEQPPSSMRLANFRLAADASTECYVSVLRGAAGGVSANVNRWRGQMGQPAMSESEIAALPLIMVLGRPSPLVEITGRYTGTDGTPHPGFMMLATIAALPDRAVFVKITGPESVVRAERDRFIAFCQSLKESDSAAPGPKHFHNSPRVDSPVRKPV